MKIPYGVPANPVGVGPDPRVRSIFCSPDKGGHQWKAELARFLRIGHRGHDLIQPMRHDPRLLVLLVAWLLRANRESSLEFSRQRCRSNAGNAGLVRALGWRHRAVTARATDPVGLAFPLAPR